MRRLRHGRLGMPPSKSRQLERLDNLIESSKSSIKWNKDQISKILENDIKYHESEIILYKRYLDQYRKEKKGLTRSK